MNVEKLMPIISDVALFVLANVFGFYAGALVYNFYMVIGVISPQSLEASIVALQSFFTVSTYIWMGCVFLSIGFFVLERGQKLRWAFLLCPVIIPLVYGLSVLNMFSVTP